MMQLDGVACAADGKGLVFAATGGKRPDPDAIWIGSWTSNDWSGWSGIGQPTGGALPCRPGLIYGVQGVMEIAVSAYDGAVWHASQAQPGAAGWLGWQPLGQPGGEPVITEPLGAIAPDASPVLTQNVDLSTEVFVVGSDLSVWNRREQRDGAGWTDWAPLGCPGGPNAGTLGPLVADANADGRVELFTTDTDGKVQHCWQEQPGGSSWSGWKSLGRPGGHPVARELATALDRDGCLELFTVGERDGAVWQRQQNQPGGAWADWVPLGRRGRGFAEVAVAQDGRGLLVLFATERPGPPSAGNGLWQRNQLTPAGGWSPWQPRAELVDFGPPGAIQGPELVLDPDNKLQLHVRVSGTANTYQATQVKDDLTDPMAWGIYYWAFQPV
jgi:hypothetical protein